MQVRVMTEPQEGGTYDDLVRLATLTERLGYEAFFRSDHLQRIAAGDPGPGSTEAWVTLAGLARETRRIRLGTMVTSASFRRPGLLALTVATVDAMSGGRVELGLGSGWFEGEHEAFGVPFLSPRDRFDVLEEQLEMLKGLWATGAGETFSFAGTHVHLKDNPALPKPVQPGGVPIIVGGTGKSRTPSLAATYADEFNMPPGQGLAATERQFALVRSACERAGRDPATLVLSSVQGLGIGSDHDVSRAAQQNDTTPTDLRARGLWGSPEEIVDKIGQLAALGCASIYLQLQDIHDDEMLERFAEEVLPRVVSAA
jgi:alkanesulfonate monooxygenase